MRRAVAFAAFAAAAVVVGLAVGVLARGDGEEPLGAGLSLTTQDPVAVTSQVEPDGAFFGQPVVARVDVQVDATQVDPARVRVDVAFDPYTAAGERTVERVDSGGTTRLTFRYPLRCLAEGCDPASDRGLVEFGGGRVTYMYRDVSREDRRLGEEIDWAPFVVTGRVGQDAVRDIRWRAEQSPLAAVTYRVEPRTTGIVLLALAVALAALAAALAWLVWGRRRGSDADAEATAQAPLALVLAAARAAARNGDVPKRRRALESVARELRSAGLGDLAVEARTLAWSPEEATSADVEQLARRAELEVEAAR
jgi:hypothetical protein